MPLADPQSGGSIAILRRRMAEQSPFCNPKWRACCRFEAHNGDLTAILNSGSEVAVPRQKCQSTHHARPNKDQRMEHHEIKLLFELPALRILRGPNAVMVLGFLYRAFKRHLRVAIAESELQAMMDAYLED